MAGPTTFIKSSVLVLPVLPGVIYLSICLDFQANVGLSFVFLTCYLIYSFLPSLIFDTISSGTFPRVLVCHLSYEMNVTEERQYFLLIKNKEFRSSFHFVWAT